jgi:hypothetical protein
MKKYIGYIFVFLGLQTGNIEAQNSMQLNVGLLLPFYSDTSFSVSDKEISQATLDYYAGMRIAAEDLNDWNVTVNFRVWDYRKMDESELSKLPKSKEFQDLDVFYGPITQKGVDLISANLQHTHFLWVSPLRNLKLPKSVESVNLFSHDSLRIQGLIETLKEKYPSHQLCLIYEASPNTQIAYYRKHLKNQRFNFTEHQLSGGKITPKLPKSDELLLVNVGTSSFSRISQFNALNKKGESYIVGSFSWYDDFAPSENVDESKIIYPNVNAVEPDNLEVYPFLKKFALSEKAEPSKFAFMGYDQLFVLGAHFASNGKMSLSDFPNASYKGLINTLHFKSIGGKTYENKGIRLIHNEKVYLESWETEAPK